MSPSVKPIVQALLIADHVYTDVATGKKIVAGIFHTIFAKRQPVQRENPVSGQVQIQIPAAGFRMGSPFAYVSLINVRGEQLFVLRYVDLQTDEVKFQAEFGINCRDPLSPVEVALALPQLPADKFGGFALELLWGDEPLGAYRVHVRPQPDSTTEESTEDDDDPSET